MTAQEQLDIYIACKVEYNHSPSLKDLFRLRELLPDSPPYSHPIKVSFPAPQDEEE